MTVLLDDITNLYLFFSWYNVITYTMILFNLRNLYTATDFLSYYIAQ